MPSFNLRARRPAPPRRILAVNSGSLLDEAVMSLLDSRPELDVTRTDADDRETLIREIAAAQPDVLVLDRAGPIKPESMLAWLGAEPALPRLRVIVFEPDRNSLDVFNARHFEAVNGDQFISLIEEEDARLR